MSAGDIVRFIRTWSTTGAIAPSGRALARRMVAHVDPSADDPILELGPGTGVVTRALLERGVPAERIIAVEYNPEFCQILGSRYPGVRVVLGVPMILPRHLPQFISVGLPPRFRHCRCFCAPQRTGAA